MVDILLGLQWGDEGKGKIVDVLAPQYDIIARFQGGPNAGHTLKFDGIKHVLHQIPSGVFRKDCLNIVGNGVVLDPVIFKKEAEGLLKFDIDLRENLVVSTKTAIIIPSHRLLDAAQENAKGEAKIGSTLKGIGPTYADKVGRNGLRVGDILSPNFSKKYQALVDRHVKQLENLSFDYKSGLEELEVAFFEACEYLKSYQLTETEYVINAGLKTGKTVLAEGAQGSLLDIDFGSYPFVTSSNTTAAGVVSGLGVAPNTIGEVFGIFKAYCTRVGSGPFPTELFDETGVAIQKEGQEFGATTGRPRRCGWMDLPALKYSCMLNGVTQLVMMKVDVLNIFEEIKICTHYELPSGELTDHMPYDLCDNTVNPVYKTFKGWNKSLDGILNYEDLPDEIKNYVTFIEAEVGIPITFISTGPDRVATIQR